MSGAKGGAGRRAARRGTGRPVNQLPVARRPMTRQAAAAVLLVAALATGRAVQQLMPADETSARPFERHGVVEEPLELRWGTLEIGEVEGSTRITSNGAVRITTGVYIVVPITFTAAGEPQRPSYVAVRDSHGRTFGAISDRNPYNLGGAAQPGIPRQTLAAVELPADAVPGAQLVVGLESNPEDHRRDDLAVIDLGLTADDATEWTAVQDPQEIGEPTDGPRAAS